MDRNEVDRAVLRVLETVLRLELQAVRQALGEEEVPVARSRRRGARRQSIVTQSVEILTEEEGPVHVNRIVELLREKFGRVTDRDSVSSALAKKARKGVLLRQPAPATFGLLEEEEQA